MSFSLSSSVSFCETSGKLLFLDLARDRYFCLSADDEREFRKLAVDRPIDAPDCHVLSGLAADRILVPTPFTAHPRPCPRPAAPAKSLLECNQAMRKSTLVHAALRLAHGRALCRVMPLSGIVRSLSRRKGRLVAELPRPLPVVTDVAVAFRRLDLLTTPLDQCLARSVAVAHALIDRRIRPEVVLGVKVNPFGAHCWVQRGDLLVTDLVDHVSGYTPILVI